MDIKQLKKFVDSVVSEAKKKGKKDKEEPKKVVPEDYRYSEAFDFSQPLGPAHNLYYQQGRSTLGGFTSGPHQDGFGDVLKKESKNIDPNSAWQSVVETINPSLKKNVWEATFHYYDHLKRGLGQEGKLSPVGESKKKEGK
jgi:hypothetical protein